MPSDYKGYKIDLDSDNLFTVRKLEGRGGRYDNPRFKSYAEAINAIDQHEKKAKTAAKRKLALNVIDERNGAVATITGIHAREGCVLGPKDTRGFSNPDFFPDAQWIADLLEEQRRLYARAKEITTILRPYVIKGHRSYHLEDAAAYEVALEKLEEEHKDRTRRALGLNDVPQVVYPKPAEITPAEEREYRKQDKAWAGRSR